MKEKKYLLYNIGDKKLCSHIDALHAQSPGSDQYTGEIVRGVIGKINTSAIIATISRRKKDLNRPRNKNNAPAIDEYRETIKEILDSNDILTKNYLHLAIHGMKDKRNTEFEIGTRSGGSCSKKIIDWFTDKLDGISTNYGLDRQFSGDQSIAYHRNGDLSSNYRGYGDKFHTIQVEINHSWRENKQNQIVKFLSDIFINFDKECNK